MQKTFKNLLVTIVAASICAIAATGVQGQTDFNIMFNFGLERGDYKDFDLSRPAWEDCRDACAREDACLSFTYTIPIAGPNGRPAHCWLKNIVPRGEGRDWCISGIKKIGCGTGTEYSVEVPRTAPTGTRVPISIGTRGPKTKSQNEWIGVFRVGTNSWTEWGWVKDLPCDFTFGAPAPGEYEVRYMLDGGYDKVAVRRPLTIQ